MGATLNIQDVINRSTSQVPLSDLTRKGVKQVKVLNQAAIVRLITEAVDRVIAKRAEEISAAERRKVIEQSRKEFESLARERVEQERSRARELENVNQTLADQLDRLRSEMHVSDELQAEFNKTADKLQAIEEESQRLREQSRASEHALSEACSALAAKEEDLRRLESDLARMQEDLNASTSQIEAKAREFEERTAALQRQQQEWQGSATELDEVRAQLAARDGELAEAQRSMARLEGELAAKESEIQRVTTISDALAEKVMSQVGSAQQSADGELIRESLEKMRKTLSDIASRGVSGGGRAGAYADIDAETLLKFADRGDDLSVDSNIQKVQVEDRKAGGVKSSLARLKRLQKGV